MQRFNFIDFMVLELGFFKKKNKKMKNMGKNVKSTFLILHIRYITDQPIFVSWHLDIIKSEINFKLKVKMKNIHIYIWFSMGINPYIHSTTVLCDNVEACRAEDI